MVPAQISPPEGWEKHRLLLGQKFHKFILHLSQEKKKELIFLQGCNSHFYNHFVKFLVLSLGSGNSRVSNQA